jgi:DNA-binding transcriptional ArsR family regulator
MQRDFSEPPEDRLPGQLAAKLGPRLQDALDHPVRREVLRALNRSVRSQSTLEVRAELRAFGPSQLRYHLQVLRRSGAIASDSAAADTGGAGPRYASEVVDDGEVKAVLRATEGGDRLRREAAAAASASPLLTMFRTPRPIRTIRLGGRARARGDRASE